MRIACLLDSDFEDSEFRRPHDAFVTAGHQVVVIGLAAGRELAGKKGEERVRTDASIDEVTPGDFDALLLPGGYSPDHLRIHPAMVEFTRAFMERDRPVFAVCHGPQLMLTAGVVEGRRMTAWPTVQADLRLAGADVVDAEVVVDRNLVTSRKPDDLDAFSREALRLMQQVAGAGAR